MNKGFAGTVLALVFAPALAADSYRLDPNHTRPMFEVRHMGFSTQHGRFGKAAGRAVVDLQARTGSVELVVDTVSIDMGSAEWDKHMKSEEFFNVENFPTMTFRSDRLLFEGDRMVGAEGEFTLLGVTRPLRVTVANFHCGTNPMTKAETCGADISARIKRSDFGMTRFLPLVGDVVNISVPVEALKE